MTTADPSLVTALKLVGFNATQATLYLGVLQLGSSSIWDIAKKTGIKRPTCYAVLDELVVQGYASKIDDGRRQSYSVVSPKELLSRLTQKQAEFATRLPLIEGVVSRSALKPKIRLYEGIEGIKQVYASMLTYRDTEMIIYGTNEILIRHPEILDPFITNRIKQNISLRIILAATSHNIASAKDDKTELRQTRFFPIEEFNPAEDIDIIGDTIFHIAHSEKEPFATAIESASFARHEREKFNLLWKMAQPLGQFH